jgi:hypothetical protein
VIATYPMIDLQDPFYSKDYAKNINGGLQYGPEMIDDHLKNLQDGSHPSVRDVNPRSDMLAYAMIQRGKFGDCLGQDRVLFPIARLGDDAQLARDFPYLWLQHGTADTQVPIDRSRKLLSLLKQLGPGRGVRYTELEGKDHAMSSEICLI